MLSDIAKNSNQLIKSRFNQDQSLKGEVMKLKNKRRNFSNLQSNYKIGSIFKEPQFNLKLNLDKFKKRNRSYLTSQTHRTHSSIYRVSKLIQKSSFTINSKQQQIENLKMVNTKTIGHDGMFAQTIHSRRNSGWLVSNKNSKYDPQKIHVRPKRFTNSRQSIEEPRFINMCLRKNALELVQNVRTAKTSTRKKSTLKEQACRKQNINKIKYTKYKGILSDQNPECRPWSPVYDPDTNQNGLQNFRSLHLKLQVGNKPI